MHDVWRNWLGCEGYAQLWIHWCSLMSEKKNNAQRAMWVEVQHKGIGNVLLRFSDCNRLYRSRKAWMAEDWVEHGGEFEKGTPPHLASSRRRAISTSSESRTHLIISDLRCPNVSSHMCTHPCIRNMFRILRTRAVLEAFRKQVNWIKHASFLHNHCYIVETVSETKKERKCWK